MKYIIVGIKVGEHVEYQHPFIFPDILCHDQFFDSVQHHYMMNTFTEGKVKIEIVSAGFCNFYEQEPNCNGRSDTLDIESRPEEDDRIISMFNYEHGVVM